MTSLKLQTLASRFSDDIIHQLDESLFFGERDFYTEKELNWMGLLRNKDIFALIDKPDQITMEFNYSDLKEKNIVNYYDKQRIKSIIQSPMFLWACFRHQHDLPKEWKGEELGKLFDTKTLPLPLMMETASFFQQTSVWSKKKREEVLPSFLKANAWQKQVMIYNAAFKEKWMFEWDMPASFSDALLRQGARLEEVKDDTYLLGYGSEDGETLQEIIRSNPRLAKDIANEHRYHYPRDRQYFHTLIKSNLVIPYRINPSDVEAQLLYSLENHLNSDHHQEECVISYTCLRESLAFGAEYFPTQRESALRRYINNLYNGGASCSEIVAERLNMLSKYLVSENEDHIRNMFSDVIHTEEFLQTLQQRPFVKNWQNILEKEVIGQDLKGNTFSKGRKM